MRLIKGVLAEELANSQKLAVNYRKALNALPAGALVKKIIKGRVFWYLAKRQGSRVVFLYKGKLSPKEIEHYQSAMSSRKKYRKLLSDVKNQIIFLKRALHERKRRPV